MIRPSVICCFALVTLASALADSIERPHIVFIVADDLGYNDVSMHGSDQILTPNIDVLAYNGVVFRQYYTDTQGTAARSALFTGKYAMRLGTQSDSIKASEDRGIPISERLLPAYLRELGYETHLIGKWDVGKSREHYLPAYRGFGTFYGFLGGTVDYYTYYHVQDWNETSFFGLDLFHDGLPVEDQSGHLTDLFTEQAVQVIRDHGGDGPLYLHVSHLAPRAGSLTAAQAPLDEIAANAHVAHPARRMYAGLVTSLDKSVGHIVAALAEKEMLENTLIVFTSDNGAPTVGPSKNFGSNCPLRGVKSTPWEGGARSLALMWHASLPSVVSNGLFHVTDWLPTLVAAAGGAVGGTVDGINHWQAITNGEETKRNNVLITIDDLNGWAAYREGDYKIVVGELDKDMSRHLGAELAFLRHGGPLYEDVLLECEVVRVLRETLSRDFYIDLMLEQRAELTLNNSYADTGFENLCMPTKVKGCLFNISDDPLETKDLWDVMPDLVRRMTLRLRTLWAELKPRSKPRFDLRADPSNRSYTWTPWLDNNDTIEEPPTSTPPFPLHPTMGEFQYLVDLNLNAFKETLLGSFKTMGDTLGKSISGLFSF